MIACSHDLRAWCRWEDHVLPLLREDRGSSTSTVEERVIGAGLQALEKNEDGPAVKKLFYAFAVTQVSGHSAATSLDVHMHLLNQAIMRRRTLCIR